eukprot:m.147380 g.147380  ORF g.147380 m.147380 type:complete len:309 (+) comp9704_c0_seq1:2-928(+)
MRALLECGADINGGATLATRWSTPLHNACKGSLPSTGFEFLMNSGALLDCFDENGNTPLALATESRPLSSISSAIVKTLLAHGADANARLTNAGEPPRSTPLHEACFSDRSSQEVIMMLLAHGASESINFFDKDGRTPLSIAVRWSTSNLAIFEALLDYGGRVDSASTTSLCTVLHDACQMNSLPHVKLLLERGATAVIDWVAQNGKTALAFAAECRCPATVQVLLEHGARVSAGTFSPVRYALEYACSDGCLETTQLLLDHDTTSMINKDAAGNTLLHYVALWNRQWSVKTAQFLLDRKPKTSSTIS